MIPTLFAPSVTEYKAEQQIVVREVPAIMRAIALCESGDTHFKADGNVITGIVDPRDTGRYQINTFYHQKTAESMGLDLFNEQDNETYALWLYETQGTQPWNASKQCWSK